MNKVKLSKYNQIKNIEPYTNSKKTTLKVSLPVLKQQKKNVQFV